ncbi:hypothetical protein ABZ078_43415 [Streptomyces sp. NPDC006385]|uniref:hypothetical protein n=1 Tax=Streptomyces sp. NPDC006385 TaxID=3156761 RepID=UPI0033B90110
MNGPNGVPEPFKAYLNTRFTQAQGQVSGTQLYLEIQARGYRGSRRVVRKHLATLRAGTAEPVWADIPSPRKFISWIMRPRETLTESQDARLLQVRLACLDVARACDFARAFADLVRHQRGYLLLEWIRQAEQDAPKPMKGFAGFLPQDLERPHRRTDTAVELWGGRRPREPGENTQESNVWPGLVRPPAGPHPHPAG